MGQGRAYQRGEGKDDKYGSKHHKWEGHSDRHLTLHQFRTLLLLDDDDGERTMFQHRRAGGSDM